MSSYLINVEADGMLNARINESVSAKGDRLLLDARQQWLDLVDSQQLPKREVLKVSGRASLIVSYFLGHELCHLYKAIAIFDPRDSSYTIVKSDSPDYAIGDRVEFDRDRVVKSTTCEINPQERSTFLMKVQKDTLKVGFSRNNKADGFQIAADAAARLDELIESKELKGGKLLKIDGRASVLVCYVIAHKLAHLYEAIAINDPKLGNSQTDEYVVAIEHGSEYSVGDTISVSVDVTNRAKIVLCGSPNTGKTVFREGLKNALLSQNESDIDEYVISGCPDGDGSWFSETASKNPELAKSLKELYKASFTPEYAIKISRAISAINNPLLVFDVGGKITDENWVIMSQATHAVILDKTKAGVAEWQKFCNDLNLPVIAVIYSDLEADRDEVNYQGNLLTGTVHYLQRGEEVASRPMIRELAKLLVSLTKEKAIATI